MRKVYLILICGLIASMGFPEESSLPITLDFLYTGSWANSFNTSESDIDSDLLFQGGTLINRGEIIIGLPEWDLSFRLQGIDRRKIPESSTDVFNPGAGIYFGGEGVAGKFLGKSRLLHGVLDEYGLPARIKNVWAKSPPYAELRKPTISELRTDPSTRTPETYLYLGFPRLEGFLGGAFSGFFSTQVDEESNAAFGAGLEYRPSRTFSLRLECFYTERELEARSPNSWFSDKPPLPERDFRLYGFGANLSTQNFGLAMDLAYSETFAYGKDMYANAALRIGSKPWKFSLAADLVGNRYVDRDYNSLASGLRIGARLERSWIRSGLFRLDAMVRTSDPGFNSGTFNVYFRPSAPRGRTLPLFRFTRTSLTLGRNAVDPLKTQDSINASLGFNIMSLRFVLTGNFQGLSVLDDMQNPLFSSPFFDESVSSKYSIEAGFGLGNVSFRINTGYTFREEKDNILDFSLYSSISFDRFGRLSFRIAATEYPDKWNYYLTWRLGRLSLLP